MAWHTLAPTAFTTAAHMHYLWFSFMIDHGAVIRASGDGLSAYGHAYGTPATPWNVFNASTPYGTGANAYGNIRAWFVLRFLSGWEMCFQYTTASTTNLTGRMKISPSGGFSGGSPSATQVPSAADEIVYFGAGTDASPTYSSIIYNTVFNATSGKLIARVQDAAPYMWWWSVPGPAGAWPLALQYHDYLTRVSASDTDPYALHSYHNAAAGTRPGEYLSIGSTAADGRTYARMNAAGTYSAVPAWYPVVQDSGGTVQPLVGVLGSAADGLFLGYRPRYGIYSGAAAPNGLKGVGTLWSWRTSTVQGVLSKTSRSDKIALGDIIFDWDGTDVSF